MPQMPGCAKERHRLQEAFAVARSSRPIWKTAARRALPLHPLPCVLWISQLAPDARGSSPPLHQIQVQSLRQVFFDATKRKNQIISNSNVNFYLIFPLKCVKFNSRGGNIGAWCTESIPAKLANSAEKSSTTIASWENTSGAMTSRNHALASSAAKHSRYSLFLLNFAWALDSRIHTRWKNTWDGIKTQRSSAKFATINSCTPTRWKRIWYEFTTSRENSLVNFAEPNSFIKSIGEDIWINTMPVRIKCIQRRRSEGAIRRARINTGRTKRYSLIKKKAFPKLVLFFKQIFN